VAKEINYKSIGEKVSYKFCDVQRKKPTSLQCHYTQLITTVHDNLFSMSINISPSEDKIN